MINTGTILKYILPIATTILPALIKDNTGSSTSFVPPIQSEQPRLPEQIYPYTINASIDATVDINVNIFVHDGENNTGLLNKSFSKSYII